MSVSKRSITDIEIGLIKAMLLRSMKNKDIQFYFNRQDRAVNSGRITQIRDGTYGPETTTASEDELNVFLSSFKPSEIGAVVNEAALQREPTLSEQAVALFVRGRAGWFLSSHETDRVECKETFCLKPEARFADPLRSIAGLANNAGGFIFFGVTELTDGLLQATGLSTDAFQLTDPAEINRCLAGALHPVPTFSTFIIALEDIKVGVIHVEKHEHPPVMATKNINTEIKEGAIYYRYVGETRVIKPGELQQIISYREQKAVAEFSRRMARIAVGSAATLDLDTGKVEGREGSFLIDEQLLPKIQFLRKGHFNEEIGAPALRLIGDVSTVKSGQRETVRTNVTSEAVLLNFLKVSPVAEPMQYIMHSAHTARTWLPLFYYAKLSKLPLDEIVSTLLAEPPTYKQQRDASIARLNGTGLSASTRAVGKVQSELTALLNGELTAPLHINEVARIAQAIQAIPSDTTTHFDWLKSILLAAYELTSGTSAQSKLARSLIYRAACRLDELEYGSSISGR
jgi:hypothetical protein